MDTSATGDADVIADAGRAVGADAQAQTHTHTHTHRRYYADVGMDAGT